MDEFLKPAPAKMVKKITEQMEDVFTTDGVPHDNVIMEALMEFTDGREPRKMFIDSCELMRSMTLLYGLKKARKVIGRTDSFKEIDDTLDYLNRLRLLFLKLTDWRVDGYINLLRLREERKSYTLGEVAALEQLYVDGHGRNSLRREEILTAKLYESGEMSPENKLTLRELLVLKGVQQKLKTE